MINDYKSIAIEFGEYLLGLTLTPSEYMQDNDGETARLYYTKKNYIIDSDWATMEELLAEFIRIKSENFTDGMSGEELLQYQEECLVWGFGASHLIDKKLWEEFRQLVKEYEDEQKARNDNK